MDVSLEMCQKLYNPEVLEIIGVEIINSQKSYLMSNSTRKSTQLDNCNSKPLE